MFFKRLKEKWQVSWLSFILIWCTFALGGSLCGYAGRRIMGITGLEKNAFYWVLYILLITILWPIAVLMVSIVFGQFSFFRRYIKKLGKKIFGSGK